MVAPAKLEWIARDGFDMIDQWKTRKAPPAPPKPTQRGALDCNQVAKMHGGIVFTTQVRTKYSYVPWNKAI